MVSVFESILNKLDDNKILGRVLETLFIVSIVALAFCGSFRGLDVTDSTYSLSNFMFLDRLDGMWFYSTFYANLMGRLFLMLPGGQTLIGIKLYSSIIKCLLAFSSYFFFSKCVKLSRLFKYLGVISALGLCWCPETIMYNYMSYLFFFLGAAFLYEGLEKENIKYLVAAGFFLGSNVFVRLPNIIEAGLIVVLWADSVLKKDDFKKALNKTLWCIAGYAFSFIPAIIAMLATRGIGAYFQGIMEMLGMSSKAQGYGPVEMVMQIIRSFLYAKKDIFILFFVLLVNVMFSQVLKKNKKSENISIVFAIITAILIVVRFYRNGVFTTSYNRYDSFFGIGRIMLLFAYLYMVTVVFRKDRSVSEKRLAIMAVMIGLITPLGTNNEVYANLNNMFFILPVMWYFVGKDIFERRVLESAGIILSILLALLAVQSVLFGSTFSFRDGIDEPMTAKAYGNTTVNGIRTTQANADNIAGISAFWLDNGLENGQVLLYGDVSGMAFILKTPVAISTAWPSLASFAEEKFETEMAGLEDKCETPTVLLDNKEYNALMKESLNNKQIILKNFLENNNYTIAYQNEKFAVLLADEQ